MAAQAVDQGHSPAEARPSIHNRRLAPRKALLAEPGR
jgi:hypothetical protein